MGQHGLHLSWKWDLSSVDAVRNKCFPAGWPPQVWPARLPTPDVPPHPRETLRRCKAKPRRQGLPKTLCHFPRPGPNLQGSQEESWVQQWYHSHLRTGFPPCFLVVLSDCLLLQLKNCFLSIPGCFWSPLHCELCWQSSLGQINSSGIALTFVLWNPKLIAYIITSLFLMNIMGFGLFVVVIVVCVRDYLLWCK